MPEVDLTEEERLVLMDILKRALADLHTEISHTDYGDSRDALKERGAVMEKVLGAFSDSGQSGSSPRSPG